MEAHVVEDSTLRAGIRERHVFEADAAGEALGHRHMAAE